MGHCALAFAKEKDRLYHDNEWGIPVHDDRQMFEHLTLSATGCQVAGHLNFVISSQSSL